MIRVSSMRRDGDLILAVEDNGRGVRNTEAVLRKPGVGLGNIIERLAQMYNAAARLEVESLAGEGFTARVVLPFSPAGAAGGPPV